MKRLLALILCAVMLLTAGCSGGEKPTSPTEATEFKEITVGNKLRKELDSFVEKRGIEGVLSLRQNGKTVYERYSGEDENGKRLGSDTNMFIASVSKQFCAAAVMLLSERGKLSLSDTLGKYFPEYKHEITLKHLLSMRSGLRQLETDDGGLAVELGDDAEKNIETVKNYILAQEPAAKPDTKYDYNNLNYLLLALIVEKASGQGYIDFLRENIFDPLGMNQTGSIEEVRAGAKWVKGIKSDSEILRMNPAGIPLGCGDLVSTADDMDKWMTGLRSLKIVNEKSLKEMTADHSPEKDISYGYGLQALYGSGYGHPGRISYYTSLDFIDPENGLRLFVCSGDAVDGIESFPQEFFGKFFGE
ncbi:MAG: beta-lactamase family protein [Ruminococcus sp.]|nr:beta-lactamase family protein [Ruminococcus sp.]